ncbi:MAG: ATP-binding cassette domain-containing protein [Thermovirgaceae bacterium]
MSIVIDHLTHVYHKGTPLETTALADVSLEARGGEWLSVVGHTGSGKSTLAQHMNALLLPTSGNVFVDGIGVHKGRSQLREIRRKVGLVFQYPEQQIFEETVYEEIAFGPKNWGVAKEEIPERVSEALSLTGLAESFRNLSPFNLSGGEKRRVAIASVLAVRPDYLVLDEPTAGLDASGKKELCLLLARLKKNGTGIVHITHDLELAVEVSDRILVLTQGKSRIWGTPSVILEELLERDVPGLELPPLPLFAGKLRDLGMDVPVTWDFGVLADAIERSIRG